ncbi:hypothetical protein ASG87_05115 [Frateuria sp. Soil773]|nr:hypothetical protein ASG87_05115 [Frateuria sp. Soil773]
MDIEFTGGRPFPQEIMSSVFSERECRWMYQDPLGIQIAGFAHWTRKEAVIKADGRGLSLEPATFELMPEPLQPKPTEWRRDRWQCMLAQSAYFGATAALCSGWVYSVACAEEADRDAFVQAFDLLC